MAGRLEGLKESRAVLDFLRPRKISSFLIFKGPKFQKLYPFIQGPYSPGTLGFILVGLKINPALKGSPN